MLILKSSNLDGMKQELIESIADRICQMRRDLKISSQEAFGKPLNVTKSTVSQWETGKTDPSPDKLFAMETKYGYRARWILWGELPRKVQEETHAIREPSNVSAGPPIRGMVPLISWVSAGRWREPDIVLDAPLDWIPYTGANPHTFALRVEGDSMEPSYPPGTYLIVDPERVPEPMNLVIALNGDHEATFKRLTKEGGVWYLTPLNRQYPSQPLDSLCKIVGVVVWSGRREV